MIDFRIVFLLSILLCSVSTAQAEVDLDWPCVQRLIPKVSAASIWDGPVETEIGEINDIGEASTAAARELIRSVVENSNPLTEAQIDDYIATLDPKKKNNGLTYLFFEFLNAINEKRSKQISTIRRFTKTQNKNATAIQKQMDVVADMRDQKAATKKLTDEESKLHWQKRMFQEREKSILYLCEMPQDNAQLAGEIARAISVKLEY